MSTKSVKNPPEKKIGPFANGIGVAIWLNTIETDDGPKHVRSITIAPRRYMDRDTGQWKDATSYQPADLPAIIFALTQAQAHCYTEPVPGSSEGEDPSTAEEVRF